MYEILENIQLNHGHLIRPLIAGTLVSITCSVIGCFIILRRMAFLADAIAHSMLAGVIAGYLLTKMLFGGEAPLAAMLVGALLAGITTVALVGFVTRFSRVKQDTAIGIMYTGIFALGAFIISLKYFSQQIHIDIYHYVVGDVLTVPDEQLWLLAIVTSVVLGVVILFFRPLQLTSFDPIMAASIGIPVLAVEYLLTICTSLVVVSGVQIAGVILVVALIITPAATIRTVGLYRWFAWIRGRGDDDIFVRDRAGVCPSLRTGRGLDQKVQHRATRNHGRRARSRTAFAGPTSCDFEN